MSSDSENKKRHEVIELDIDFSENHEVSNAFFNESQVILADLDEHILRLETHPHDEVFLQGLFRKVHTLKGSVGAIPGGQLLGSLAHEFETLLDRLRKQKIPPSKECIEIFLHSSRLLRMLADSLRSHRDIYPEELSEAIELIARYGSFQLVAPEGENEPTSRLAVTEETPDLRNHAQEGIWLSKEQLMSLMQVSSDFIILKNSFHMLVNAEEKMTVQKIQEQQNTLSHSLNLLSDQLQNVLDKAQKISLKVAFAGLFPLVRQTSYELKKDVRFEDFGFDLEVDKVLAVDLYKSLTHMVRNSLDHGIETAEDRMSSGKGPQGHLKIKVEEKGSLIHCLIEDDGRGLNKDRILERALEKGLTNALEAAQMSEEKIFSFIFHPGFSTKDKITTISGRGVGMDVVHHTVVKYGGEIIVKSEPGKGALIHLTIPVPRKHLVERCLLTLWKEYFLAFPLSEVSHISSCDSLQVTEVDKVRFCQYDNHTIPALTIEEIYQLRNLTSLEEVKKMSAVFLKFQDFQVAVLVDKIHHQGDLVIKPFGNLMRKIPGFKGSSVLSDEKIAYVADAFEVRSLLRKENK